MKSLSVIWRGRGPAYIANERRLRLVRRIAWLVVTIIIAAIANALPARRASHLTLKDTLAYE